MKSLILQRCFNHYHREAAARCPECGRFFCRECVTEHEDRVLCASCLSTLREADEKVYRLSYVFRTAQCFGGFFLCWLFFYVLGLILLSLPESFHEGTLWQTFW